MSSDDYLIHVKSTLDKLMHDLVDTLEPTFPGLTGVDVDNLVETDEMFKSTKPVLLWQFLSLREHPVDPLYRFEFLVGAKTVADSANYTLVGVNNELKKPFKTGTTISVGDYSGAVAVPDTGYFLITDNSFAPQQYDHLSGIRFFSISAMGSRKV